MNKYIKLLIVVLLLAGINIGLFTLSSIRLTSFWISWSFIHIALLIFSCIFIFSVPEQKKLIHAYSESAIATYYLIIELVAGCVLAINFALFPVVAFVIQGVILAGFILVFYLLKKMNQDIDSKEEIRRQDLIHFSVLVESMKDVLNKIDYSADYKKTVEHAYDAMAASPVKSSQDVYEKELSILAAIEQLEKAVISNNDSEIFSICKDIELKIADRNRTLRLNRY